eukprot:6473924-Amphidinium_carterae.3
MHGENKAREAPVSAFGCAVGDTASDDLNSRLAVAFTNNRQSTGSSRRYIIDDTTEAARANQRIHEGFACTSLTVRVYTASLICWDEVIRARLCKMQLASIRLRMRRATDSKGSRTSWSRPLRSTSDEIVSLSD